MNLETYRLAKEQLKKQRGETAEPEPPPKLPRARHDRLVQEVPGDRKVVSLNSRLPTRASPLPPPNKEAPVVLTEAGLMQLLDRQEKVAKWLVELKEQTDRNSANLLELNRGLLSLLNHLSAPASLHPRTRV